jgi:hypothetical protein
MKKPLRHPWPKEDPDAIAAWQAMTPGQRFERTLQMADEQLHKWRREIRDQYPDADDYEVRMRVGAKHLPRDLMLAAFGWDPAQHDAFLDPNYCQTNYCQT